MVDGRLYLPLKAGRIRNLSFFIRAPSGDLIFFSIARCKKSGHQQVSIKLCITLFRPGFFNLLGPGGNFGSTPLYVTSKTLMLWSPN